MQLQPTKYFATFSVVVQECFLVYCRSTHVVKLLRFLLTPYSLIGDPRQCAELHFSLAIRDATPIFIILCSVYAGQGSRAV
jgi:hypothetical protein